MPFGTSFFHFSLKFGFKILFFFEIISPLGDFTSPRPPVPRRGEPSAFFFSKYYFDGGSAPLGPPGIYRGTPVISTGLAPGRLPWRCKWNVRVAHSSTSGVFVPQTPPLKMSVLPPRKLGSISPPVSPLLRPIVVSSYLGYSYRT